jgi:dTDP-4-amino-4,6-dideoxygalactose transaminase
MTDRNLSFEIPMSSPDLSEVEINAVRRVLGTTSLSIGPQIEMFENEVRKFTGSKFAIGVNSGTAGLHLCVRAAGIEANDLVITTPFSFVASTNVILFEKAIPVFVDVDPGTGNINVEKLAEVVKDIHTSPRLANRWLPRKGADTIGKLKAILPVDVFGQPADLDSIGEIARSANLQVIEDSCEALGTEYKGRKAGTLGDYGVFGFYPNKQITTGEGGMIVTDDEEAAEFMRALRNQGRAPGDTWLSHTYLGYNYRMDELSAALGYAQMTRIDHLMQTRQQVADWYGSRLAEIPGIEPPIVEPTTTRSSWFVYVIHLPHGINRQKLAGILAEKGIPVRPYFLPIHLQPYMVQQFGYRAGDFPVTEDLGERGLALPFSGVMTEDQVDQVCRELQQALIHAR